MHADRPNLAIIAIFHRFFCVSIMQGALFKTLPLIAAEEGRICNQIARFEEQNRDFLVYWVRFMPLLIDEHAMPRVFKRSPGQKLVTHQSHKRTCR